MKKMFIGWTNIKWLVKQLIAMYSNDGTSYFSKKRFESAIAFLSATWLILWHAYSSRATITNSEILADAALLFTIAGYTLNHIQKEKKDETSKTTDAALQVPQDPAPTNEETDSK